LNHVHAHEIRCDYEAAFAELKAHLAANLDALPLLKDARSLSCKGLLSVCGRWPSLAAARAYASDRRMVWHGEADGAEAYAEIVGAETAPVFDK